jgi:hypothetical protein
VQRVERCANLTDEEPFYEMDGIATALALRRVKGENRDF